MAKEQDAVTSQSVPSSPAGFLVVAFKVPWQVIVYDKTHIGFIDPHTEGNSGNNDVGIVLYETFLVPGPLDIGQAGMVWQGPERASLELFC